MNIELGMAHRSYRGMEGDILGLNRSGVEIHHKTVNDTMAWGGTQPNDVNQAVQRQHVRDERQCCYSMAKKKEKREDGNGGGWRHGCTMQKGRGDP